MLTLTAGTQICYGIVANALRDDRRLHSGDPDEFLKIQEALTVLITSTTRLAAKMPYLGACIAPLLARRP